VSDVATKERLATCAAEEASLFGCCCERNMSWVKRTTMSQMVVQNDHWYGPGRGGITSSNIGENIIIFRQFVAGRPTKIPFCSRGIPPSPPADVYIHTRRKLKFKLLDGDVDGRWTELPINP
jgi:hypothetical protein